MYSNDILQVLADEREGGTVLVLQNAEPGFDLIEKRFPVGMGRIAWDKIANKRSLEVFPLDAGERDASEVAAKLEGVRERVAVWLAEAGVAPDERVIWVGDETDIGVETNAECALKHFAALFSLPQHAYLLGKDRAWCLNYVMEGELFFASV